jgi:predicted protein tyrosine phosphatase
MKVTTSSMRPRVKLRIVPCADCDHARVELTVVELSQPADMPLSKSHGKTQGVLRPESGNCELQAAFERRDVGQIADLDCGIYLGRGSAAADTDTIKRHGITHVLNVADDVPRAAASSHLEYCCLEVGDFGTDRGIARVFSDAFTFVSHALDGGGNVFVHCANGSNRSPTVAVAMLMMLYDWPLCTAYEHVASRRQISPLADNRRQLLAFEASRRGGVYTMVEGAGGELVQLAQPEMDEPPPVDPPPVDPPPVDPLLLKPPLVEPSLDAPNHGACHTENGVAAASIADGQRCDRCDKTDHATEDCPFFSKPADAELTPGRVEFDKEANLYSFLCPHCDELCTVLENQVNCRIFRHAQLRPEVSGVRRLRWLNMHAPQRECERWVREGLIHGCGRPFRFDGRTVTKCGYI